MIKTQQQYDHVWDAVAHQEGAQKVSLGPEEPNVEALVIHDEMYIASPTMGGKTWSLVARDSLADGLQLPQHNASRGQGGTTQTKTSSFSEAPTMLQADHWPLDTWSVAVPPSSIFLDPVYSHSEYTNFLRDQPHRWYAVEMTQAEFAALSAPAFQSHGAQHMPSVLSNYPTSTTSTIAAVDPTPTYTNQSAAALASTQYAVQAPREPESFRDRVTQEQVLEPNIGQPDLTNTIGLSIEQKSQNNLALRLIGVKPHSGGPPHSLSIPSAKRKAYVHNPLVDAQTGGPPSPSTVFTVSRHTFYKSRMVDAQTGKRPSASTISTVTRQMFYKSQMVDPETGAVVSADMTGAIKRSDYYEKRRKSIKVDPETGASATSSSKNAISGRAYSLSRLVDPITGKLATAETQGAITRAARYKITAREKNRLRRLDKPR